MTLRQHSAFAAAFEFFLSIALVASVSASDQNSRSKTRKVQTNTADRSRKVDPLLEQVNEAIQITSNRILTADVHTPWQILHGVLALRHEFQVKKGDQRVPALEWMSDNATFGGKPLFQVTRYGAKGHAYTRDYVFEGHPNQFLAILTMSNLPLNHEMTTGGRKITIADVVKNSKMETNDREEVTWTLWALSHYLPSDARWHNKYGESWSIERLVQIQTYQKVTAGACGGTHGLFALAYARNKRVESGGRLGGSWFEADQKIKRYVETARWAQNHDGSFSASYFEGRRHARDFATRIDTSGHILEFLMMALPHSRLSEDWVRRGIHTVSRELIDNKKRAAKCGPLYHALHGLVLYRDRVSPKERLAKRESTKTQQKQTKPAAKAKPNKSESKKRTPQTADPVAESKNAKTDVVEKGVEKPATKSKKRKVSAARAEANSQKADMKIRVSSDKNKPVVETKTTTPDSATGAIKKPVKSSAKAQRKNKLLKSK